MKISFSKLIQKIDSIKSASLAKELKLRQSGDLIYQGSVDVLKRANLSLDEWQFGSKDIALENTLVDQSFSDFLRSHTQQAISTSFLEQYLVPRQRQEYTKGSSVEIKSLTPGEAIEEYLPDIDQEEIIALAHEEKVDDWIKLSEECLKNNSVMNLTKIIQETNLSLAQVFISLLFGDFCFSCQGDFYDGELEISLRKINCG